MAKSKKKNAAGKKTKGRVPRPPASTGADHRLDRLLTAVRAHPDDICARLDLAEHYRRSGQAAKITELLADLEPRYPFADPATRGRYNFLVAFGHAQGHRLVEAEKAARRGLEEFPEGLDFLYVLAYVHLSLREFDKVIPCAETFIKSCEKSRTSPERPPFSITAADLSQVYNFLGAAYNETGRGDEAERRYRQAIQADLGNHLPYLNLIKLLNTFGRRSEAQAVTENGLAACRQIQELRMLSASLRKRSSVSACLMVKNEEELLPQCLDSIRDWVDEIIVVDTGSADRTVEIARSYGARIFHQAWEGNFSKHRNYSIEQATGDWIFIIDADECFYKEDVPQLRRLLDQPDYRIISINVYNVGGANQDTVTFLPSVRFFKREVGLKYEGIVHNLLNVPPEEAVLRAGVRIKHYGYGLSPEKMKAKLERSRALLEKQLQENPDNYHAHFNYAQLLRGQGLNDHPEYAPIILQSARRAVELTDPKQRGMRHVHLMALHQIAWVHFVTGNYQKARQHCLRAIELKADYLDPILLLGHIEMRDGRRREAQRYYRKYLETQAQYDASREIDNIILLNPESRESAHYGLGAMAFDDGQYETAARHFESALETRPGFLDTDTRLGWTYLRLHRIDDAQNRFRRALETSPANAEAVVGMADIHYRRKEYDETESFFRRALELNPDHGGTLMKFGELSLELGQLQQAAELFRRAIAAGHDPALVRPHLAETCFRMERFDEAAELYRSIIESGSGDARTFNDLGNCYFNSGRYDEAEQQYLNALEIDDQLVPTYRNLGLARIKLDQPAEAAAALEKYLQLNPEENDIWLVLGSLYAGTEEWDTAINCYERSLQCRPSDPLALFGLSECYFKMGHQESAVLGYRQVLALDPDFQPARDRLDEITRAVEPV